MEKSINATALFENKGLDVSEITVWAAHTVFTAYIVHYYRTEKLGQSQLADFRMHALGVVALIQEYTKVYPISANILLHMNWQLCERIVVNWFLQIDVVRLFRPPVSTSGRISHETIVNT